MGMLNQLIKLLEGTATRTAKGMLDAAVEGCQDNEREACLRGNPRSEEHTSELQSH